MQWHINCLEMMAVNFLNRALYSKSNGQHSGGGIQLPGRFVFTCSAEADGTLILDKSSSFTGQVEWVDMLSRQGLCMESGASNMVPF